MKVYLLKDVPKIGIAGEILNVAEGFGANFLIPKKLAVHITEDNVSFYQKKAKTIEQRKDAIATETSMMAEKIKTTALTLKKKMHDDDRLYAAVNAAEVVDLFATKGIKISKSQVIFDKAIKTRGSFEVTIKLSSRLQPVFTLKVVPE